MINFIECELINSVRALLNSVYNDKTRFYHNYNHINDMLKSLDDLIEEHPEIKDKIDYRIMRQGIIFHDIIQGSNWNEFNSSEITDFILSGLGYENSTIDEICKLILVTDYGKITDTANLTFKEKLIRDLDLKGLGSDWHEYRHNGFLVRQEYPVPQKEFELGRKKFLKHILSFDKIYSTEYFQNLENIARENMERELKLLS